MTWIVRHTAWLIPRFRCSDVQLQFYRAKGGPYSGKLVEFGETVLAHLPEVRKGSGNPAPKLADIGNTPCGSQLETPVSPHALVACKHWRFVNSCVDDFRTANAVFGVDGVGEGSDRSLCISARLLCCSVQDVALRR